MSGSEGVKSLPVHPVMRPSLGSSHKRSVLADTGTVLSDVSLAIVQSPDRPSWEAGVSVLAADLFENEISRSH